MARDTIKASEKSLLDVFCDKYRFSIPPYQRPYAWTTEEVGELLDDLLVAAGEEDPGERSPYFLGSIVLIKDPEEPQADVVDGQQRLTTLTIMLAVFRDLLDGKPKDRAHSYLCEQGDPFAGTTDLYRLRLREREADFFKRTIQEPNATQQLDEADAEGSDARTRIVENAQYLKRRITELPEDQRMHVMTFMIRRCFLVIVEASDAQSAYRVFSVMNDRGLDLSPTDILKADVIGAMPEDQRERYTDIWEDLEDALGRDAFRDLFGHIRMIFRKAKMAETLEAEFKRHIKPAENPVQFVDETLQPLADAYLAVVNQDFASASHAEGINRALRHLSMLDNSDWEAPAILFMARHKQDPESISWFLKDLDRLAYALFITRANINERIARYSLLIASIEKVEDLNVEDSPLQMTKNERDDVFHQLNGPIYDIKRIRLPVLLRLDEEVSDGSATYDHRIITVEHVLPQNPEEPSEWLNWFPDENERSEWTHRIANLALLSSAKNSQAQNFEFDRKKTEYFTRKGTSPFAITSQVLSMASWKPQVLAARQKMLLEKLGSMWRLGGLPDDIEEELG
ncbi:MAG: DUF262 domain-containing HNH endonuclease family protein [Alphaproteobacteria bacterium]